MAVKKQSVKKQTGVVTGSRQAAYSARNRARLIKDAQMVLAEIGPSATIEQIASHAEVSPTTIYKYFENKDALFVEALSEAWDSFIAWAYSSITPGDPLENALDAGRKILWVRKTHPLYAEMIKNSLNQMPDFLIQSNRTSREVFKELAKNGLLKQDDFNQRFILWVSIYTGILKSVIVTEDLSPSEAEVAFGIGLSVWGISEAKANKIISRPLQFPPVK
jgi:AcrR family transcriptional regulator